MFPRVASQSSTGKSGLAGMCILALQTEDAFCVSPSRRTGLVTGITQAAVFFKAGESKRRQLPPSLSLFSHLQTPHSESRPALPSYLIQPLSTYIVSATLGLNMFGHDILNFGEHVFRQASEAMEGVAQGAAAGGEHVAREAPKFLEGVAREASKAIENASKNIAGIVAGTMNDKDRISKAIQSNPRGNAAITTGATLGGAILGPVLMGPVLGAVGFSAIGPIAGENYLYPPS